MPRVHKTHHYEAVRLGRDDIVITNGQTGPRGKPIPRARYHYMITDLDTGEQWFLSDDEFHGSGWAAVDPADNEYFGGR